MLPLRAGVARNPPRRPLPPAGVAARRPPRPPRPSQAATWPGRRSWTSCWVMMMTGGCWRTAVAGAGAGQAAEAWGTAGEAGRYQSGCKARWFWRKVQGRGAGGTVQQPAHRALFPWATSQRGHHQRGIDAQPGQQQRRGGQHSQQPRPTQAPTQGLKVATPAAGLECAATTFTPLLCSARVPSLSQDL